MQGAGSGTSSSLITINENGGILNIALRPTAQWRINGTVEMLYDDNALTPIGPRQTKHYRFHTLYKLKPWATISGAWNDLERHNNTFNTGVTPIDGPLGHVDHTRNAGAGLTVAPSERYGFDVNYNYSNIYISTNACYLDGATATLPGTASTTSSCGPNICPGVFVKGSTTVLSDWGPTKDFMDAPTSVRFSWRQLLPEGEDPAWLDLESRVQLLWLRRRRSLRSTVLQQFDLFDCGRCPLQLSYVGRANRIEGTILWLERTEKHACQHCHAVHALRVLTGPSADSRKLFP